MIEIDIPGYGGFSLEHLVMDYNGTLALDGHLMLGVREEMKRLAQQLTLHVITADTNLLAAAQLEGLPASLTIIPRDHQAETKLEYVRKLGLDKVVAIGNGRNDRLMLEHSAVGIALIQKEGAAAAALQAADIVSDNLLDAFDLLLTPARLVSTLRS